MQLHCVARRRGSAWSPGARAGDAAIAEHGRIYRRIANTARKVGSSSIVNKESRIRIREQVNLSPTVLLRDIFVVLCNHDAAKFTFDTVVTVIGIVKDSAGRA